jgi:hypothetical protein
MRTGGFVMDGEKVKLPEAANGSYYDGNGTSFSSPIFAGMAAVELSKDTLITFNQLKNNFARDAKDYGPVGADTIYGR